MSGVWAQRADEPDETDETDETDDLFDCIGAFLRDQRLSPDPANYAFAHHVASDPESAMARAVRSLTNGGVRLSRHDIERLGGDATAGPATARPRPVPDAVAQMRMRSDGLVAQTQMQVEGFTDMVRAIRTETEDFGRELAASADAMRLAEPSGVAVVMQLAGAMLDRVRTAETRLEAATHEARDLRAKLEEARGDARRDPLTALPNRRAFEEAFAAQAAGGAALCIAVCDVDRFKDVNDRFGHAVGDRVLKAIADALSQACAGHLVSRYGGEEFAILFVDVDPAAASQTLEAARQTVAAKRFRLRESDEPLGAVTFSAGLAGAAADEPLARVFGRADSLLYIAKNAGRNRIAAD